MVHIYHFPLIALPLSAPQTQVLQQATQVLLASSFGGLINFLCVAQTPYLDTLLEESVYFGNEWPFLD